MKKLALMVAAALTLVACQAQDVRLNTPDGNVSVVTYYPGSNTVDDLMIINGVNYYGKVSYDISDPLTDITWRQNDGTKVQAECILSGKAQYSDSIECKQYEVYRSNNDLIPVGTKFKAPKGV